MCVPIAVGAAELSRRRLLGLGAAGLGATLAPGLLAAGAQAAGPLSHRHGTRVVLLGTAGGPPPEIGRTGISSALVVGDRTYVVDCGRSAVTQFKAALLQLTSLKAIFITHLHADHAIDFFDFFMLGGFGLNDSNDGIVAPVDVYGPGRAGALPPPFRPGPVPTIAPRNPTPGLADLTRLQMRAFAYSTNLFLRDSGIPDPRTLLRIHEVDVPDVGADPLGPTAPPMEPFTVADDGVVRVSAVLVPHGPVFPSFAYRFDTPDGSVVFSGDTAASENVVRLAHGADLLVHEVIDIDFYERFLGLPPALLEHLRESHTDVTELGPLAERADVDTLVLTHLVPADPLLVSDRQWRRNVGRGYGGRVLVGNDLLDVGVHRTAHHQG
jgi:ribonuclease BN (tRNA processing enzyme)